MKQLHERAEEHFVASRSKDFPAHLILLELHCMKQAEGKRRERRSIG